MYVNVLTYPTPEKGSVLVPLLRGIMYNDVLNLPALEEAMVVGYANNIPLVAVTKHFEGAASYSCEVISALKGKWLYDYSSTIK